MEKTCAQTLKELYDTVTCFTPCGWDGLVTVEVRPESYPTYLWLSNNLGSCWPDERIAFLAAFRRAWEQGYKKIIAEIIGKDLAEYCGQGMGVTFVSTEVLQKVTISIPAPKELAILFRFENGRLGEKSTQHLQLIRDIFCDKLYAG